MNAEEVLIESFDDEVAATPSNPTEQVIERFGGIRPMAAKLDIPVTTVQGWKKRGAIPKSRHEDIVAAAQTHGIDVDAALLAATGDGKEELVEASEVKPDPALVAASLIPHRHFSIGLWLTSLATIAALVIAGLSIAGVFILKQRLDSAQLRLQKLEQSAGGDDINKRLTALEQTSSRDDGTAPVKLSDVDRRLSEIALQANSLSQRVQELQLAAGGHDLLTQTVNNIQSTIASVQAGNQSLAQSLDATKTKLAQLDTFVTERRDEVARQFSVLLAVDQLRLAAESAEPFTTELNSARLLAHADSELMQALERMAPFAEEGAPTLNELRVEFNDLASEIVRSTVVGSGKSWFKQALYRLSAVISVRKIGAKVEGNSAEALVARTEGKLQEDDLAGAVATLQGLTGLPKDVASAWIDSANQRLGVDAGIASLTALSIERVGGTSVSLKSTNTAP